MNHLSNLTKEDLTFLKELAKELRTQDTRATAKPLVFKIRETVCVPYKDLYYFNEDVCLIDPDERVYLTAQEALEALETLYEKDAQALKQLAANYPDMAYQEDLRALYDLMEDLELDWELTGYEMEEKVSGSFLTARAAQAHLNENCHHYNSTAHVYCTHAWRNPELEQLLTIVEKFDSELDK